MSGCERSEGSSSSSTAAKNASRSRCATITFQGYVADETGRAVATVGAIKRSFDEYLARHHRDHGRREVFVSIAIAGTLAAGALVGVAWAAGFGEVARHLAHPRWKIGR